MKRILMMSAGLLAIAFMTAGCAHRLKPPRHTNETAQLAVPVKCIDKVMHGTETSRCVVVEGQPDLAVCDQVIVHFTCTKVKGN